MKTCSECKNDYPVLWKAKTREHGALCKDCWGKFKMGETSLKTSKKTLTSKNRIKPVSDKRAKKLVEYRKLRDDYMKVHKMCEVEGCNNKAVDLHHKVSREFALLDTDVFMAVCRSCHLLIEEE